MILTATHMEEPLSRFRHQLLREVRAVDGGPEALRSDAEGWAEP